MHPIRADRLRDIHPVVHDERSSAGPDQRAELSRQVIELACVRGFHAQLKKPHAGRVRGRDELGQGRERDAPRQVRGGWVQTKTRDGGVQDQIEPCRERDASRRVRGGWVQWAHWPPHTQPAGGGEEKRSRKAVEKRPFWKSGSSRMRRCSGIVVLIPSITHSSNARRIRARASSRVRPWTISFAINES